MIFSVHVFWRHRFGQEGKGGKVRNNDKMLYPLVSALSTLHQLKTYKHKLASFTISKVHLQEHCCRSLRNLELGLVIAFFLFFLFLNVRCMRISTLKMIVSITF